MCVYTRKNTLHINKTMVRVTAATTFREKTSWSMELPAGEHDMWQGRRLR